MYIFDWFADVFAAPSDKARLIAILITSALAFLLFFLNQWFLQRRQKIEQKFSREKDNRELLTAKTEELFLAANKFTSDAIKLVDVVIEFNSAKEINRAANEASLIGAKFNDTKTLEELSSELKIQNNIFNESMQKIEMLLSLYFTGFTQEDCYPTHATEVYESILNQVSPESTTSSLRQKLDLVYDFEKEVIEFSVYVAKSINSA